VKKRRIFNKKEEKEEKGKHAVHISFRP